MRRPAGWWLVPLFSLVTTPALALEQFCNHQDLCAMVPRDSVGVPVYNTSDLSKPWVVGGTSTLSLPPGTHRGGTGPFGPVIFVVDNGSLLIEDQVEEVSLESHIILCDQATFRVRNATWRSAADTAFQYWVWADGNSQVVYDNAHLSTLKPELATAGAPGALLQVMQGHSTFTAVPSTPGGYSLELPRFGLDVLELGTVENATTTLTAFHGFGEFYVAGQANFAVTDSFFFDVFFEACPGATLNLPPLPALCDLHDAVNGCITPNQAPADFSTSPPATPFTLTLTQDRVFSWAVSTYQGSNISVPNVPVLANFAVGLGSLRNQQTLLLAPGNPATFTGLTDRTLAFPNSHVSFWHVWPGTPADITLLPGSHVGDLLPGGEPTVAHASQVVFDSGSLQAPSGTAIHLDRATINETLANLGGKLWLTSSTINQRFIVDGTTWTADTPIPAPPQLDLRANARLLSVNLTAPANGTSVDGPLVVQGSVDTHAAQGQVSPFPAAHLEADNGTQVVTLATFNAPTSGTLATVAATQLAPGNWTLRLRFDEADGAGAAAERTIVVPTPAASSSSSSAPGSFSAGASSAGSSSGPSSAGPASSSASPPSSEMAASSSSSALPPSSSAASSSAAGTSSAATSQTSSGATSTTSSSASGMSAQPSSQATGDSAASSDGGSAKGCVCAAPAVEGAPWAGALLLALRFARRRK